MELKKLFAEFWVRLLHLIIILFLASLGFAGIWLAVYFWHTSVVLSIALIIFGLSCLVGYFNLLISEVKRLDNEVNENSDKEVNNGK